MERNKTTTQETSPWGPSQDYWKDLYARASEAMAGTQGQYYTGPTLAQPNANQQSAVDQVAGLAPTLSAGADPLRELALSQIRGDWLSPDTNPYIGQVAQAAINPLQTAFNRNIQGTQDRLIAYGAYGGSRQDIQENQALDDFTRAAGDITSNIYAQNFANERSIQQNSGSLLELANALSLAGPTALANAGDVQQGWDQAALDDAKARWLEQLQSQWGGLGEFANILSSGGFGTTTTTEPQPNGLLGILKGALGGATTGASLASGIGGVAAGAGLGAFAPWMLPLALVGGLAGAL